MEGREAYRSANVQEFLARFGIRNKQDPETTISSSKVVLGRRIEDPLPHLQDPRPMTATPAATRPGRTSRIVKRSPAMRAWKENSQRTVVNSMSKGDFFVNEQSHVMAKAGSAKITTHQADSATKLQLQKVEVIDATKLSTAKMCEFFEAKMAVYSEKKLMTPLRVKATRRKVPNPIILGQCVKIYFKDVFAKHDDSWPSSRP